MYKRIRKAREDLGYTREKFAELLDVSVSYMAEVERGRTGISVKMLVKICNMLGLSADYVLFGVCLALLGRVFYFRQWRRSENCFRCQTARSSSRASPMAAQSKPPFTAASTPA